MARSRNIKPGFFKNEDLVVLPYETRLLFIGLWTLADREGRLEDRPQRIKMEIFPADNIDLRKGLDALVSARFLTRYEVEGTKYLLIDNFVKHQHPHHKEVPSTLPAPVLCGLHEQEVACSGDLDKCETLVLGTLHEEAEREQASVSTDKSGASPSDSLIPDSLIPDSLQSDSLQKQKHARKKNGHEVEQPQDVSLQVWGDWKRLRANKRAAITPTALAGIRRECKKAGISFENALALSCERGWAGFKAEWIAGDAAIDWDALEKTAREREEASAH